MWEPNEGDMKSFGAVKSREKTTATLGDRWSQTSKQERNEICGRFFCNVGERRIERPIVAGIYLYKD